MLSCKSGVRKLRRIRKINFLGYHRPFHCVCPFFLLLLLWREWLLQQRWISPFMISSSHPCPKSLSAFDKAGTVGITVTPSSFPVPDHPQLYVHIQDGRGVRIPAVLWERDIRRTGSDLWRALRPHTPVWKHWACQKWCTTTSSTSALVGSLRGEER